MPIYEFRCETCQDIFEHLALVAGETLDLKCPKCGGESLSRVLSSCASVMGETGQAGAPAVSAVQNRSCGKGSSCSTITLPGHTR